MFSSLKHKFVAIVFAVGSFAFMTAAQAQTYRGTVNGTTYDFTTITGTANELSDSLDSQPWFGSQWACPNFCVNGSDFS